jgi:threonine/homoserine efflux transporter RhtA
MLCWIGESLLAFAMNQLSCGGAHLTRRIFRIAGIARRGWMGVSCRGDATLVLHGAQAPWYLKILLMNWLLFTIYGIKYLHIVLVVYHHDLVASFASDLLCNDCKVRLCDILALGW